MSEYPLFDGGTYVPRYDGIRLETQLGRVFKVLQDGQWHDALEIDARVPGILSGLTARVRDFRKKKFGGYIVESRRKPGEEFRGIWEYRLSVRPYASDAPNGSSM